VLQVAASLPDTTFAHGVGTALLLADDVTSSPLIPIAGVLVARAVVPDLLLRSELRHA
jgi:O-succinylbenzoate synthase